MKFSKNMFFFSGFEGRSQLFLGWYHQTLAHILTGLKCDITVCFSIYVICRRYIFTHFVKISTGWYSVPPQPPTNHPSVSVSPQFTHVKQPQTEPSKDLTSVNCSWFRGFPSAFPQTIFRWDLLKHKYFVDTMQWIYVKCLAIAKGVYSQDGSPIMGQYHSRTKV